MKQQMRSIKMPKLSKSVFDISVATNIVNKAETDAQAHYSTDHMDVNHSVLSSLAHQDSNIFLVVLKQVFSKNGWAFCVTHDTIVSYPVFRGRNTSVSFISSLVCFFIQALCKMF